VRPRPHLAAASAGAALTLAAAPAVTWERIADKLGVHARTAAVAEAMRRGLLD
jgi:hypothetical protein